MFYKIGKKVFKFINNFLHFLQIILVFLSFFVILYWILQIAQVSFIQPFAPFFETIKNITNLFYNRVVTINNVTVDFSFLVAVFLILSIAWFMKILIEWFDFLEQKFDKLFCLLKKKEEVIFNNMLEKESLMQEYSNNKFIILINFYAINLLQDSFFSRDIHVGVKEKESEFLSAFIKEVNEKLKCEQRKTEKGLFLYFDNFNNIDNIIYSIEVIITDLKNKYAAEKWKITSLVCIEPYAATKEIPVKTKNLEILSQLEIRDEIICMSPFKQRYLLQKNPKYFIEGKGIYKISELTEEVFCIKSLR